MAIGGVVIEGSEIVNFDTKISHVLFNKNNLGGE